MCLCWSNVLRIGATCKSTRNKCSLSVLWFIRHSLLLFVLLKFHFNYYTEICKVISELVPLEVFKFSGCLKNNGGHARVDKCYTWVLQVSARSAGLGNMIRELHHS